MVTARCCVPHPGRNSSSGRGVEIAPPHVRHPPSRLFSVIVVVNAPATSLALYTAMELARCPMLRSEYRHDTCGLPKQPDISAFHPAHLRSIEPTAPAPLTGKSVAGSSMRLLISTHGLTSAPGRQPAIQARAPCCPQSGTHLSRTRAKSGADP